jgi:uncharacterized membrane protein YhaH (DUF805 family)
MISFFAAFEAFFFRYFNFFGRAARSEFWLVMPVIWMCIIGLFIWDCTSVWFRLLDRQPFSFNPFSYSWFILFMLTLIPRFSLTARRLNDAGRSLRWIALPYGALFGTLSLILGVATALPALQPYVAGVAIAIAILGPKLLSGSGDAIWEGLYLFAATAQYVNWAEAISNLWSTIPQANLAEVSQGIGDGFRRDPAGATGALSLLGVMVFSPVISMTAYLWFMAQPSQRHDNGFGAPPGGPGSAPRRTKDINDNPFAGYAALMERTPEQERAIALRRKAEVRALYRERILKQ